MRRTTQIFALIFGALGVALIVRGAWGGIWPPSIQLLAGLVLVAYAAVRWVSFGRPRRDRGPTRQRPRGGASKR